MEPRNDPRIKPPPNHRKRAAVIPLDTTLPDPALIALLGCAGSGKSTLASTWPDTAVLELDGSGPTSRTTPGTRKEDPAMHPIHLISFGYLHLPTDPEGRPIPPSADRV